MTNEKQPEKELSNSKRLISLASGALMGVEAQ